MKRIIVSMMTAVALLITTVIPAYAANNGYIDDEYSDFNINDYIQYRIDINSEDGMAKIPNRVNETNGIDKAIEYVKSLDLSEKGFDYIEDACLSELENYKADGVILEQYTVLVPKIMTRAGGKTYYGSYLGNDFYYDYTSISNFRKDINGTKKGASNKDSWNKWVSGTVDLAVATAGLSPNASLYAVGYSAFKAILGTGNPADIHYGSYHRYTMQFTEAKTRNIYREKSGKMSLCYQDQSSSLRVSHTFCPVGTKFTKDHIDLGIKFNGKIKGTNKSKNEILQLANQYANRGAKVVFGVTGTSLKESWK